MTQTPAIEGWFTTGPEPALIGSRCTSCGSRVLPAHARASAATRRATARSSRTSSCPGAGTVWSYTDAQYQPPPPYIPATDPFEPFALAAVELPEGLVVLGQVAEGYGVGDLRVGAGGRAGGRDALRRRRRASGRSGAGSRSVELGEEADQ